MTQWRGSRITLRAVEPSDGEIMFNWIHNEEIQRHLSYPRLPYSREAARAWAAELSAQSANSHNFYFIIENHKGEFVGIINTFGCEQRVGHLKYGLGILPPFRRQGMARETIILVLRYYFENLNYQKATVDIHSNNPGSVTLHERLGFVHEGRMRRVCLVEGERLDLIVMGVTVEEFNAAHSTTRLKG